MNRLSLGVQSLDPDALRMLGRQHSVEQARAALEMARAIFPRLSFDLIYARPGQTLPAWRAELRAALALAADHLSLYQLTIEPGTAFATRHARGEIVLPDGDAAAALYEATAEEAARFGLLRLRGVQLRPAGRGKPAQPDLLALRRLRRHRSGRAWPDHPRAATCSRRAAIARRRSGPSGWSRTGTGPRSKSALQATDKAREMLLMGLRLTEGVDAARFAARTGLALEDALDPEVLAQAVAEGYLDWQAGRLVALPAGRLRLDALLAALVR